MSDGKSPKWCVIYRTKINDISAASQTVCSARIAPKICRCQPQHWLTLFRISSKLVHFRRSYSRTGEGRFWHMEYLHNAPRTHSMRIIILVLCFNRCSLLRPNFSVENAQGVPVFKLSGPVCLFQYVCCPLNSEFPVSVFSSYSLVNVTLVDCYRTTVCYTYRVRARAITF